MLPANSLNLDIVKKDLRHTLLCQNVDWGGMED